VRRWFLNPYTQIGIGALLVTASELLLKLGATSARDVGWFGVGALASAWTWAGIATYLLSFGSWLYVLRKLPLSVAVSLMSMTYVLVPLSAWLLLHESISMQRLVGIVLVLCGTVLVARSGKAA
jgi:drug/metabolite transporter (DMT)-like permease